MLKPLEGEPPAPLVSWIVRIKLPPPERGESYHIHRPVTQEELSRMLARRLESLANPNAVGQIVKVTEQVFTQSAWSPGKEKASK